MSEVTLERSAQLIPDKQSALVYDFAPTKLQTRVCTLQCIVRFTSYVKSPARQDPASCLIDIEVYSTEVKRYLGVNMIIQLDIVLNLKSVEL